MHNLNIKVLGIETSCDETAVAIYTAEQGLVLHEVYSQIEQHQVYGGVVPELASRDHIRKLLPMIAQCLKKATVTPSELTLIAYTAGPGLIGALLVGATLAQSLAFAWNIPAMPINHLEGHLLAPMLDEANLTFPFLCLLVSGGHTLLVNVNQVGHYDLLGQSLDDAAGEAFDKVAKLLGLPYPGGPALAKLAEHGQPGRFSFPRPMLDRPGLDFSFSGLKTHVRNCYQQMQTQPNIKANIAWAFQDAVVDTLLGKLQRAIKQTGSRNIVIAGGVSANLLLRARLQQLAEQVKVSVFMPRLEFCTDNAAMIAYAGYLRLLNHQTTDTRILVKPNWPLQTC